MERVVVMGDWGLRHDEPGRRLRQVAAPGLDAAPVGTGRVVDLRRVGLANVAANEIPLALAVRSGDDTLTLDALAMRLDAHRVQFWAPPGLPERLAPADLAARIAALYQDWHLPLNNFECNQHPLPGHAHAACGWALAPAASARALAGTLLAALDEGVIPAAIPQPGHEYARRAGPQTYLSDLDTGDVLALTPGGRKKKPAHDSPLWHLERFAKTPGGAWCRAGVSEHLADTLRDFDRAPEAVAATLVAAPLRRVGQAQEVLHRLCIESQDTGALIELDAAHYRRDGAAAGCLTLRLAAARYLPDQAALEADLTRIAEAVAAHIQPHLRGKTIAGEPMPQMALTGFAGPAG